MHFRPTVCYACTSESTEHVVVEIKTETVRQNANANRMHTANTYLAGAYFDGKIISLVRDFEEFWPSKTINS